MGDSLRYNITCIAGITRAAFAALVISLTVPATSIGRADTLNMKDGSVVKGVVVEEYKDRLLVSTVDGEKTVMKSLVGELRFDDEESNLVKLGDQAKDKGRYMKAVEYYGRALKANPDCKAAREGLLFLQLYISGSGKDALKGDVRRQGEIERDGGLIRVEKDEEGALKEVQADLMKYIGIRLCEAGDMPQICVVRQQSPAEMSGIAKGDILVAIWGRLTRYMSLRDVGDYILRKGSPELKLTIERSVRISLKKSNILIPSIENIIGASLRIGDEGLVVSKTVFGGESYSAGIKTGDVIVYIDGKPTRYMTMDKVKESIIGGDGVIEISFRRIYPVWKKD